MERLKRFEYCHDELIPYIQKVLDRLDPEKKEAFLSDESVQVISSNNPERGFRLTFSKSVKSIIYINIFQTKEQCVKKERHTKEDCFIYGIAHEIGHHFAGYGESRLLEKEANDWLGNWGDFDEIIKAVNDQHPINEGKGYESGYKWACSHDSKELWKIFEYFLIFWNDKKLPQRKVAEDEEELLYASKPYIKTVLDEYGEKTDNEDINKGIAFGIMRRVRELEKQEQ